jgi:hypothetical protein
MDKWESVGPVWDSADAVAPGEGGFLEHSSTPSSSAGGGDGAKGSRRGTEARRD